MRRKSKMKWAALIATILFFAIVFVIGMAMHGIGSLPWLNWSELLNSVLLFLLLGAYYGTIVSLDAASGMSDSHRPLVRTVLCGIFAGVAVLHVQYWYSQTMTLSGPVIGFVVGAFLGWIGWRWAKYVDF